MDGIRYMHIDLSRYILCVLLQFTFQNKGILSKSITTLVSIAALYWSYKQKKKSIKRIVLVPNKTVEFYQPLILRIISNQSPKIYLLEDFIKEALPLSTFFSSIHCEIEFYISRHILKTQLCWIYSFIPTRIVGVLK